MLFDQKDFLTFWNRYIERTLNHILFGLSQHVKDFLILILSLLDSCLFQNSPLFGYHIRLKIKIWYLKENFSKSVFGLTNITLNLIQACLDQSKKLYWSQAFFKGPVWTEKIPARSRGLFGLFQYFRSSSLLFYDFSRLNFII